jgi:hypothetical protein
VTTSTFGFRIFSGRTTDRASAAPASADRPRRSHRS